MDLDSQIDTLLGGVNQPQAKQGQKAVATPSVDEQIDVLLGAKDNPLKNEIQPIDSKPEADWDGFRQAVDAASFGTLSKSKPAREKAKTEWESEHGKQATAATLLGTIAPSVLLSTAAEQGIFRGGQLATKLTGLPVFRDAAKFLTGMAEGSPRFKLLSQAVSGAGQGALSAGYARGWGQNDSVAGGALAGAVMGPAGNLLFSPLQSSISPAVRDLAQSYMRERMPLTLAQIPGSPRAVQAYSKLFNLGKNDVPKLTESLMKATGSNAKLLNENTLANARGDIKGRLKQTFGPSSSWDQLSDLEVPKAFNTSLASGLLKPDEEQAIKLAQNQWVNTNVLERVMHNSSNVEGLADPEAVLRAVQSRAANYPMGLDASAAAAYSGNPVDLGTLAKGGMEFSRQPHSPMAHVGGLAGLGVVGAAAEHFMPLIEHSVPGLPLALTAGGTYGMLGGMMNSPLYMNLLLKGGVGPLGNPLIPAAQQLYGNKAAPLASELNPVSSAQGAEMDQSNWEDLIRSRAQAKGINPDVAMKVARTEGLGGNYAGDNGSSFGPFQLHYGGIAKGGNAVSGLGDLFTNQTGLHASDPKTVPQQVDFALDYAKTHGWSSWHGWKGDDRAGLPDRPLINVYRAPDASEAASNAFFGSGSGDDAGNMLAGSQ